MMYKAFSLIGVTAALFLSQGCGGKKKEVAAAPTPAASQPESPAVGATDQGSDQGTSSGPGAGATTMMPLPGGSSGGNSGGDNSGGVNSGGMPSDGVETGTEGESQNSGGASLSGGTSMSGGMPP